jgi:antitoxin Phd
MARRYSIAEARQQFAAIVHELEQEPLIELTRRGKSVAVLLSLDAFQRMIPPANSFWDAYTAFCTSVLASDLDDTSDLFHDVRDRSVGREVSL